jgi:hypothetical protein
MVGEPLGIEVTGLLWDYEPGGNVEHLARNDVAPADVQAVLDNGPLFFRGLESRTSTHAIVGRDNRGRSLLIYIIATPELGIWKPVTGWRSQVARRLLHNEG